MKMNLFKFLYKQNKTIINYDVNEQPANIKSKKLIVVLGIPRSGLTLITSILGNHEAISSWYLPFSTRRNNEPAPLQNFEDILEQYNDTFPSHHIASCNTWVISESTSDNKNIQWLKQSLENISNDNTVDIQIIWGIRSLTHTYLSQCYAAKKYWGADELKITQDSYNQYLNFVKNSYKSIHSLIYPYSFTLLSYDALVKKPDDVLSTLMQSLGLCYDKLQKDYYLSLPLYKVAGDPGFHENPKKITFENVEKRNREWSGYSFMNRHLNDNHLNFYKEFERLSNYVKYMKILSKDTYRKWVIKAEFEPEYYLLTNDDVRMSGMDPLEHYIIHGWNEFRNPNCWFDINLYLQGNIKMQEEPLSHYLLYGRFNDKNVSVVEEGRYENLMIIDPEEYEITSDLMLEAPYYEDPSVSIIIPAYNQENYTLACIESIIKYTEDDVSYEIIIMDDKSPNESARSIGKYMKNILFHSNSENQGFLKNCNIGATFAKGEYLLFLNNDTNVQPGWLSALVSLITKSDDIGMVGSRLVYPTGQQQEAGGIVWNDASGWNFGRLKDPHKPEFNYVKEADYLTGAAMMIRTSLWKAIGGFDERYVPAYYEDTDLAFEVRKRGYKTLYQPKSIVVHFEGISNGTDLGCGVKQYQVVNKEKFYEKWKDVLTQDHYPNAKDVFLARDRSGKKKHMLFVDHYLPHYDQDAGSKATYQYLKIFAKNNIQVHFIGDNFYEYPGTPYLESLTNEGIEVLYGNWYAQHWQEWFTENGKYFDYVVLSRPHISVKYIDIIRSFSDAKIIYYGHDLHFLREQREYNIKKEDKYLQSSEHWKEVELELIKKADVSYFFSNIEKAEIHKYDPISSVDVVPLYIFDSFKKYRKLSIDRKDIMFVGGFAHAPNVDATVWFVHEVWPHIEKAIVGIKFYIIGSKPTDEILALASDNIIVTGFVDDDVLEQYYQDCKVVVAPLRFGAGIKGKIVDALYRGVPIVTTSIGAEGLDKSEDAMMISDDPLKFADHVIDLYQDDLLANKYAQNGLEYCKKHFSTSMAKEKMSNIFDEFRRN